MKHNIKLFVLIIFALALMNFGFVALAQESPEAFDDAYETDEDTVLTVDAASGVLANDTDADSDPLTAMLDTDVSNGTLVFNADGSFEYTPNEDFSGVDTFTYHANDGTSDSEIATVTITVNNEPVVIEIEDGVVIIVIQGPVEDVNVEDGEITIFGITIKVDEDDPSLTVIQIGDVISVSGELELELGNLVLIFGDGDFEGGLVLILNADTIIFISVEVYILDGQVWRDSGSGNCQNPPPPWAPAHGWRSKCESNGGGSS